MKAKKSLIITLFAAVMTFALGASMVFAATPAKDATWDLTKHEVTVNGQTYGGVEVNFQTSDGLVVATAPAEANVENYVFYDLTDAAIDTINGAAVKSNYQLADYEALKDGVVTLKLKRPAYATDSLPASTTKDNVVPNGWKLKAAIAELEASATTQNGTVTVEFEATSTTPATLNGTVTPKTVYVQGNQTKAFKLDGKGADKTGSVTVPYDAKAHTLVANEVYGYTVSYAKFNSTTGKWDAVDAISFKNVEDSGSYKAIYTKNGTPEELTINVTVSAKSPFTFGFDTAAIAAAGKVPAAADPAAFIKATGLEDADYEEAMKYFAAVYEIESKVNTADSSLVTWTINDKEDVKSADVYKAFTTLSKNYGITSANVAGKTTGATTVPNVRLDAAVEAVPEIEFTDTPTAITYKAKKLKKKAASFTVTAVADNGEAVTYKLIDAPAKIKIDKATGEITLGKGLKKGTYKIQVKAYIQKSYYDANGFLRQPAEYQNIKIKVKK